MKNVAILTDFINYDPAYSLCSVVANQCKMLPQAKLIVRKGFGGTWPTDNEIVEVDPGEIGSNVVNITGNSVGEIESLAGQLKLALDGIDVILTHDLIYQANLWKYHIASRRLAKANHSWRWLHWVHSSTNLDTIEKMGRFKLECQDKFPYSMLVAMHNEEINRKGTLYGYEHDQIVMIPNPVDLTEDYHDVAKKVIAQLRLYDRDVIAIYPARLDRGKQAHIVIEIFERLRLQGWDGAVVIVDFHSVSGDKDTYRNEMKSKSGDWVLFTSSIPEGSYHIPHKAVMDLFEYSDVFIHPSRSESDPLTIPEAMWKRCGLMLNFDLPVFRQYDGKALFGKFSSAIDVHTQMPGSTETEYSDRGDYMNSMASAIAYEMQNNMVLFNHASVRKERSLEAVASKYLVPAIEAQR